MIWSAGNNFPHWLMRKPHSSNELRESIVFISTMAGFPWGGSEELWSRAALSLVDEGFFVGASVHCWSPPPERIVELAEAGVDVQLRVPQYSLGKRLWDKIFPSVKTPGVIQVERFLSARTPAIVVFSDGGAFHPIELLELCVSKGLPFATISHVNHEDVWPDDDLAERYRKVLPTARRCYFVSNGNRELFEKQIGCEVRNGEIIRNPFKVDINASPPWLPLNEESELRFACVARLDPRSKGQDILLEVLAEPAWRSRSWRLSFYGEGPWRNGIERMVEHLGLQDRVQLPGYLTSVEKIWAENHVLVMPSRYEGLPLAMVEAMFCSRPVVATDVAGHSEIVDDGVTGFLADAPTVPSVNRALERLWARRMDLEAMGKAAGKSIRQRIPADPVGIFAEKIKTLAGIQ